MPNRRSFLRRGVETVLAAPLLQCSLPGLTSAAQPPPGPPVMRGPALAELLIRNRHKHPGRRFSNHLSMAALSMAALGGSSDRIKALGDARLSGLDDFPAAGGPAVTPLTWTRLLGQIDALPGFHAFFAGEVASRGVAATLRLHLPPLLPGLGAHAFHAIIRTGYGVRFDDPAEVAMGLAYWAATFRALGKLAPASAGGAATPAAGLAKVRATPALVGTKPPGGMNIGERMQWAAALPGFAPIASGLTPEQRTLADIASAMVRFYVVPGPDGGDDLAALHAVTGTHAYRLLEPFVTDPATGRRFLWQAVLATYLGSGAPAPANGAARAPAWSEIVTRALGGDDHDLKLTDIAREEHRRTGDDTYQRAAAFRLRMT